MKTRPAFSNLRRLLSATMLALALVLSGAVSAKAAWSGPDGALIFVGARPSGEDGQVATGLWSIEVGRANTLRQLSTDPSDRQPQLSPDGGSIVFVRAIQSGNEQDTAALFLMDKEGGNVRQLTQPAAGRGDGEPAFDATGEHIFFSRGGDLYRVGLEGGGLRQLTGGPAVDGDPASSSSGRQIVFTRSNFLLGKSRAAMQHIFSMRPNGSRLRDLTGDSGVRYAEDPDVSPDGRTIAFAEGGLTDSEVFTMRSNGSHLRKLPRVGLRAKGITDPAFSPSGETIIAVAVDSYGSRLVRMPADGRHAHVRSTAAGYGWGPAWGPAG